MRPLLVTLRLGPLARGLIAWRGLSRNRRASSSYIIAPIGPGVPTKWQQPGLVSLLSSAFYYCSFPPSAFSACIVPLPCIPPTHSHSAHLLHNTSPHDYYTTQTENTTAPTSSSCIIKGSADVAFVVLIGHLEALTAICLLSRSQSNHPVFPPYAEYFLPPLSASLRFTIRSILTLCRPFSTALTKRTFQTHTL